VNADAKFEMELIFKKNFRQNSYKLLGHPVPEMTRVHEYNGHPVLVHDKQYKLEKHFKLFVTA
jgi:hypothetical protein